MFDPLSPETIHELLRTNRDGSLYHRESRSLEFKESFNYASWSEYLKDFAAFANNIGGYIILGITDSPRTLIGLGDKYIRMFENTDEAYISGEINKLFSPAIEWDRKSFLHNRKYFGIFYIAEAKEKPIIAKHDERVIKNGEIYYRYAGRTQKIEYAELNKIIQKRIEKVNQQWHSLMSKISKIGPTNAAILDTEKGLIEKDENNILLIDKELIPKIKFIREGHFSDKEGASTLRLTGDVTPVNSIEVVRYKKQNLLDQYPLTCSELITRIKNKLPNIKQNQIYEVMKENNIRKNTDYSAFIFRNKQHDENYKTGGVVVIGTPSIYNQAAVDFLIKILK